MPVFFGIYYAVPFVVSRKEAVRIRLRNLIALIFSYVFYAWGAPKLILLLILGSFVDYFLSKGIEKNKGKKKAKTLLLLSLFLNLGALAYYKYTNFFFEQCNYFLQLSGGEAITWEKVILPIGISFFTFQKISYVVDVYRGTVSAAQRFEDFALYVALFPQLIAGPIIRYFDVAEQLKHRDISSNRALTGLTRFSTGLGKKVLIANPLGAVADLIFTMHGEALNPGFAWLGILSYTMQIYFDFAGYSDMAIGLGRMMGFDFLENFNRPYISKNVTEFWRRWHISLSNWMREYLYIPLGGNKVSKGRVYINLWIVFLLSGLWHGASWTFITWGALHGLMLTIDKLFWLEFSKKLPKIINIALVFTFIMFTWVLFRVETFAHAWEFWGQMTNFSQLFKDNPQYLISDALDTRAFVMMIIALALSFLPTLSGSESRKVFGKSPNIDSSGSLIFQTIGGFACLFFSVLALSDSNFNPFIYFRF